MALLPATGSELTIQGAAPSRPSYAIRITFDGDAAYATAGSAGFTAFVRAVTGDQITIRAVHGRGYNAGRTAFTHFVRFDAVSDKLQVFILADGLEVADAVDLNATKFEVTVWGD